MTKIQKPTVHLRKKGSYSTHEGEEVVTGALAERIMPDGRRKIKLNQRERSTLLRQQRIEAAVALFLDLETPHSWTQIAEELGISVMALKDITKTKEFMEAYNAHFVELGHDPRVRATQAAVVDMLPTAVRELKNLITGGDVSPSVKLNAIREIFKMAGVSSPDGKVNDRSELAEFLKGAGVNIETVNVNVPASSGPASPAQVVDAEFRSDSPQSEARSSSTLLPLPSPDDIPS